MSPPVDPSLSDAELFEAEAIEHFVRARSGDLAAIEALETWLAKDPRHRAAYANVADFWDELEPLRTSETVRAVIDNPAEPPQPRWWQNRTIMALAASIALIVGTAGILVGIQGNPFATMSGTTAQQAFATRVGETKRIALADGTTAILDTDSEMTVRIGSDGPRDVTVSRGRAWFDVAKMPGRPFTVQAGPIAVRALGTRFDVYRKNGEVEVNLVEGRLRVDQKPNPASPGGTSIEIGAGQHLQAPDRGSLVTTRITGKGPGWMDGELAFDDATIATIARELNRYTQKKIVVTDPDLGNYKISAVFRTSDPKTFLDALETAGIAKTRRTDTSYIIEPQ